MNHFSLYTSLSYIESEVDFNYFRLLQAIFSIHRKFGMDIGAIRKRSIPIKINKKPVATHGHSTRMVVNLLLFSFVFTLNALIVLSSVLWSARVYYKVFKMVHLKNMAPLCKHPFFLALLTACTINMECARGAIII